MATKVQKKVPKQRRTKKESLLLAERKKQAKPTAATRKPVTPRRTRQTKKVTTTKAATKPTSTPVKRSASRIKKISLPIGRNAKLVITFKTAKRTKNKKTTKKLPVVNRVDRISVITFVISGLIGSVYFGNQVVQGLSVPPIEPPAVSTLSQPKLTQKTYSLPSSKPTKLRIAAIDVATPLPPIGLNSDDTITVPDDPGVPGWYKYGVTPGEIGPSVIVGHVDSVKGPGIFWRLRELKAGQIVNVDREDGTVATFKISKVKNYPRGNFPTDLVYGASSDASLRIITCGGTFSSITGKYSDNTIVFASLVR